MDVPALHPTEVGDRFLLDVREPDEWAAGHAPQAVHVPLHDVPDHVDRLPRDAPIAVICHVGARSAHAAAYLLAQGFDACNVIGGMDLWADCRLPVVRG